MMPVPSPPPQLTPTGADLEDNAVPDVSALPRLLRSLAAVHPKITVNMAPGFALQLARRIEDADNLRVRHAEAMTVVLAERELRTQYEVYVAAARAAQLAMTRIMRHLGAAIVLAVLQGVAITLFVQTIAGWF